MVRVCPVAVSSSTTSYDVCGLAAMPMILVSCTARVSAHAVQAPTASTSSPVSGSSTPSRLVPRPWMTAISPLSSSRNQRRPIFHSGPPNSSPRPEQSRLLGTTEPATASGRIRWSSHQSPMSDTKTSEPSRSHSTWTTDSSVSPTRGRTPVKAPSAVMSAIMTTVPSHGIRGWSQAIQAARRPS